MLAPMLAELRIHSAPFSATVMLPVPYTVSL